MMIKTSNLVSVCARERNIESKPPLFYSSAEFCFLAPVLLPQIFGQNMTKMRNKNHSADKCASQKMSAFFLACNSCKNELHFLGKLAQIFTTLSF
jgi:hypothetical protein